jgi:putative hydrolase of the HAD superfamily
MREASVEPLAFAADIKAIFFDLDDTLCAYWEASKLGLRKVFDEHGPEGFSADDMMRHWAQTFREFSPTLKQSGWYEGYCLSGEPTRTEQMRLTLKRIGIEDQQLAEKLSESYAQKRNANLRLFPEAQQVLDVLRGRYPLGLITNGPADIQRQEIATLGIEGYFEHIFIEGEMGEGKPLQAVFDRAAAAVGLKPNQLLFVGNSYRHDIKPALAAGWRAVWIRRPTDVPPSAGGGSPAKVEEKPADDPHPDAVIGDLREVLDLLAIAAAKR